MNSELCILLVDDIPENIKIMRASLADLGCKILIANGGYRAIEIATTALPDLILLDVMMPDLSGFDVFKQLKSVDKTKEIPIMFVTGKQNDIQQAYTLGCIDFIAKPINTYELLMRVKNHIEMISLKDQIKQLMLKQINHQT